MVNVRLVGVFRGVLAAPKALAICGGATTVSVADAVFPLPAAVESMVTLLL